MSAGNRESSGGRDLTTFSPFRPRSQSSIFEREILRVVGTIPSRDDGTSLAAARNEVLRWASNRAGKELPLTSWGGAAFELLSAGRNTFAANVEIDNGYLWSIRGDDPDKSVPGRVWSTEVTLGQTGDDNVLLGVRLIVNSNEQKLNIEPSVPGLVLQIAERCGLSDGDFFVSSAPHVVQNEDQALDFVDWLGSISRKLPVVVASGDERSAHPDAPLINARDLAQRLCGLAHVVVVPAHLTYAVSDEFGKSLSIFHGGVRIYNPGFDVLADTLDHRLYLPEAVLEDPAAVVSDIRNFIARDSLRRTRLGRDVIPFATIRSAGLRQEHERIKGSGEGGSDTDQLIAAVRQIAALEEENETLKGQATQSLELSEEEAGRAEASEKQLYGAWARIKHLEGALHAKGVDVDDTESLPSDWDEFVGWCENSFAGRLSLSPAARKGVRKPEFGDITVVARCIRWLAIDARDRFMNGGGAMSNIAIFEGVSNAPCGADEYNFDFQGRRLIANWHVKNGGNTRQPERCLRIYYTYDESVAQIVVSDMPAHRVTGAS